MKTITVLALITIMGFSSCKTGFYKKSTRWFKEAWTGEYYETDKKNATLYRPLPEKKGAYYFVINYYKSGKIQSEGYIENIDQEFNNEQWHKKYISYYSNGDTMGVINYKNGLVEGMVRQYYHGMKPKSTVYYHEGKREGVNYVFFENGKIRAQRSYLNGIEHGLIKYLNDDGSLDYSGYMKNGKKEGHWVAYLGNGIKLTEYEIINGELNGKFQQYNGLGELKIDAEFNHGDIIFYKTWSTVNKSNWRSEAKTVDGIEQWKHYRDEVLVMESSYKNERRTSEWKFYSLDGKRVIEIANYSDTACINTPSEDTRISIPLYGFSNRFHFPEDILPNDYDCLDGLYMLFDKNGILWKKGEYYQGEKTASWYVNYGDSLIENEHPLYHIP